jgi:molybdopterin converting factor small subunit
VDGEIYNDAPYHALKPDSEVYFIPRVAGGQRMTNGEWQ